MICIQCMIVVMKGTELEYVLQAYSLSSVTIQYSHLLGHLSTHIYTAVSIDTAICTSPN